MSQILRSIDDATAHQPKASANYAKAPKLVLRSSSGVNSYAYLLVAGVPTGSGVIISEFLLNLTNDVAWSGSHTITVARVTSKWSPSTLTWNRQPTVTTVDQATLTKSGAPALTNWAVDISTMAQAWASGAPNYGVRITINTTAQRNVYSANASGKASAYKPFASVDWSQVPTAPTAMNPDSGTQVSVARPTITWNYSDRSGNPLTGYRVQLSTSDTFGSLLWDSQETASTMAQAVVGVDVPTATTIYGRVQHRNAAGWSPWSATFTFGRTAKNTVAITNPGVAPNDFVQESTPPIIWTASGTQSRYQVTIYATATPSVALLDSGVLSGPDQAYTFTKPIPFSAGPLTVRVRSWDSVKRATTPGDPAYAQATREFTYSPGTTTPVTSVAVTFAPPKPFAYLSWSRATAPDSFTIFRDSEVIAADLAPEDVTAGGTSYAYVDTTASPGAHTWRVATVVNGVTSSANTVVPGTVPGTYIWLLDPDDPTWFLPIAGQDAGSWAMGEQSEVFEVRGSDRLVIVSESLRGYEGSISGSFHSEMTGVAPLTAQALRDRVWALKRRPTNVWRLVLSDLNIPVVVRNVVVTPTPQKVLNFGISFDYYQQGELPWT